MKILQINSVCGIGSTGRIATDLYKVIQEQGYECKIAYGRGNAPKGIDSIKIGSNIDNYINVFKTRIFDNHGFGSVNATKTFIEEVKKYDPDVIHLHNIHGYYINIELLFNYLKEANKPIVWTLHDCWAFTGHCAYFDYVGCDKWKDGCNKCQQKQGYPTSYILDNSKFNYEKKKELFTSVNNMTIVTPSQWLANLVKESFLGKYSVEVINNGIDLEIFKPTKGDFREIHDLQDKFIILGVASVWDERKGLKFFNTLANNLSDDYKIILIGIKENQKKNINPNIICIDKTNDTKELAEFYSIADVFVNPTLEDNFPTTNLEALACGTPVITFKTGGSTESIDERTGILVEQGNENELIKSVLSLKDNELIVNNSDCISRAKKYYNKNNNFKKYVDLYNK